jgi:hypothetical protein
MSSPEKLQKVGISFLRHPFENIGIIFSEHSVLGSDAETIPENCFKDAKVILFEGVDSIFSGNSGLDLLQTLKERKEFSKIDWNNIDGFYFIDSKQDFYLKNLWYSELKDSLEEIKRKNKDLFEKILLSAAGLYIAQVAVEVVKNKDKIKGNPKDFSRREAFKVLGLSALSIFGYFNFKSDDSLTFQTNDNFVVKFRNFIMALKATYLNEVLSLKEKDKKVAFPIGKDHKMITEAFKLSQEEKLVFINSFFEYLKDSIRKHYEDSVYLGDEFLNADAVRKKEIIDELEIKILAAIKELEDYIYIVRGVEKDEKGKQVAVTYDVREDFKK